MRGVCLWDGEVFFLAVAGSLKTCPEKCVAMWYWRKRSTQHRSGMIVCNHSDRLTLFSALLAKETLGGRGGGEHSSCANENKSICAAEIDFKIAIMPVELEGCHDSRTGLLFAMAVLWACHMTRFPWIWGRKQALRDSNCILGNLKADTMVDYGRLWFYWL